MTEVLTCVDCEQPTDEFESLPCDDCRKPVCSGCMNECEGGNFAGCRDCHARNCTSDDCWKD